MAPQFQSPDNSSLPASHDEWKGLAISAALLEKIFMGLSQVDRGVSRNFGTGCNYSRFSTLWMAILRLSTVLSNGSAQALEIMCSHVVAYHKQTPFIR